ncbi:YifB family Mg chelatase-like AAA ATPase [Sneathiella limimaris]|uniref:YifB family Mg chelatase-like AAA ATPase n=1 Tax=Sneathiella limimaris TaxID=1964213 RepID=UPI00146B9665|nr:YifB family Mg chelatase-like AAA ATPase [Sneathiella limimaris]
MQSTIRTVAFQGLKVRKVMVQVLISSGLPAFTVVGLADKSVTESKERVRAALTSLGIGLPAKRITVNLSPADLPKEGAHYDLPIAFGLLTALGIIPADIAEEYIVLGELSLNGVCQAVAGVLPAAVEAVSEGLGLICPKDNGSEALWAGDLDVLAADSLLSVINHFKGSQVIAPPSQGRLEAHLIEGRLEDIKGQETAKRALEVAAAGGHNLLMSGPPGSGKSMLAARLPGILPELEASEALEVSMISSIAGELKDGVLSRQRPFRDPHHSASVAAIIGGGRKANPGEVSLAHKGVLFLDELPEFNRQVLETLRQPIETGKAVIARANLHITYPARFQLVAAMNPCRCGYLQDPGRACSRAPKCGMDYQGKISGPMLDRFDLFVDVPEVSVADLTTPGKSVTTKEVATSVARAREIQKQRYQELAPEGGVWTNSEASGELLEKVTELDEAGMKLIQSAASKFRLSARGYHRVLRVARTLADLETSERILQNHIAEALAYRQVSLG